MCGILGLYSLSGITSFRSAIQSANDLVRYRGPDGAGFAVFSTRSGSINAGENFCRHSSFDSFDENTDLVLAHRRLAIIDLSSAGLQPMSTGDGRLWITYNGEIYNYIELRKELESCGHTYHDPHRHRGHPSGLSGVGRTVREQVQRNVGLCHSRSFPEQAFLFP